MKTTQICPVCLRDFTRSWAQNRQPPAHCSRACANRAPGRMTTEIRARIGRRGAAHHLYKGGWLSDDGYVVIGSTRRSHVVWDAAHPTDPVKPGEIIHHINGIKDDDRPENLEKLESQAAHAKHHFGGVTKSPEHVSNQAAAVRRRTDERRGFKPCEHCGGWDRCYQPERGLPVRKA